MTERLWLVGMLASRDSVMSRLMQDTVTRELAITELVKIADDILRALNPPVDEDAPTKQTQRFGDST